MRFFANKTIREKKALSTMDKKYEALFTPWKIGNVEIKNRIVMCPMGGTSLFGWFELTGCHFDKEAAKLFLARAKNNPLFYKFLDLR